MPELLGRKPKIGKNITARGYNPVGKPMSNKLFTSHRTGEMEPRENVQNGVSVSFSVLMELEKVSDNLFKSRTKGFRPGAPFKIHQATYGGHVYSQAVYAASHTVQPGFVLSSVSGFFILAGNPEEAFLYNVRVVRDGKNFCIRAVDVTQDSIKGICFTCTCSFKRASAATVEFQERANLRSRFASILKDRPEGHPDAISITMPWFKNSKELRDQAMPFPGLVTKAVDVDDFNASLTVLDRRQLIVYTTIGDMPSVEEDPNLHACAHLYASDRNSLFAISAHLNLEDETHQMASLNHTVVFHTNAQAFSFNSSQPGTRKWFVQEAWAGRTGDERGLHQSKIWDWDTEMHIATTMQDGLARFKFGSEKEEKRAQENLENGRPKI